MTGKKDSKKQGSKRKQPPCPLCNKITTKRIHLLGHVVNKHYKAELLELIGKKEKTCKVCKKTFGQRAHFVSFAFFVDLS